MKKKLVAVLMSSVLAMSLAACGGGETTSTDNQGEQQTQQAKQEQQPAEQQAEQPAGDEQVDGAFMYTAAQCGRENGVMEVGGTTTTCAARLRASVATDGDGATSAVSVAISSVNARS